jgi:hypothetical protein
MERYQETISEYRNYLCATLAQVRIQARFSIAAVGYKQFAL